jgi:hypothetical protein
MKLAATLALVLLAGCAGQGAMLDEMGRPPQPPLAMSDEQAGYLLQQATQLRERADAVRVRLAREGDRRQRFRYYEELRALGDRLAPVERVLRDSGRPIRSAGGPSPAA